MRSASERRRKNSRRKGCHMFENFVIGAGNRLAADVARRVVEGPAASWCNPLVITGACGSGKSALLQAIADGVREKNDGRKVLQTSMVELQQAYVDAIGKGPDETFWVQTFEADVLIVDDFDLRQHSALREVLRERLVGLVSSGRQIVLAARSWIGAVKGDELDVETLSRLSAGLVLELGKPDSAVREGVLRRETHSAGVTLPDNVVRELIAIDEPNLWVFQGYVHRAMAEAVREC